MKIVADENVDRRIIERLRAEGHSVSAIVEEMQSSPDPGVLAFSLESKSLLITEDKDFGELVFHKKQAQFGTLLVRLEGVPRKKRIDLVCDLIAERGDELINAFSVLTPYSIRIRDMK
ncbi:MAG: DUF5615 family PIN-like protein [Candidatus Kapaibacterium sp.]